MTYDFWDYLPGAIVLAAFLVPVLGAILIQVAAVFVVIFAFLFGGGQTRTSSSSRATNDYDEDEYH
jgi:integral membrane sensor domain MASE1